MKCPNHKKQISNLKFQISNLILLLCIVVLTGCYRSAQKETAGFGELSVQSADSLSFLMKHHYSENYNFIISADSLVLLSQQPEERVSDLHTDTFAIYKDARIVVADIRILPNDTVDSVWVQVANEEAVFGWVHEMDLLARAVPDDPISQFINVFSDVHLLIFLVFLVGMALVYVAVLSRKHNVPFVHLRDIDSIFPMLLCLMMALSATLYASIQMFASDQWQHFYFHPTLNPFSVSPLLSVFLTCVWAIIVLLIATIDDVFKRLPAADAVLYMGGVGAVCAVNYVVFSISTLYFVGYLLFALYLYISLKRFLRYNHKPYICGNCGSRMRRKGRCPYCNTMNE